MPSNPTRFAIRIIRLIDPESNLKCFDIFPCCVGIDPRQPDASSLRSSTVVHRHPQPETHRHSGRNTTLHARIVFNIVLPQYDEMKILCCWGQTVDFAVDSGDN